MALERVGIETGSAPLERGLLRDELEDRELVVFVIALAALAYAVSLVRRDARIPDAGLLVGALVALCLGLFATNLEGFLGGTAAALANAVEHVGYVAHTVLLVVYARRRAGRGEVL